MTHTARSTLVFAAVLAVALAGSVAAGRRVEGMRSNARLEDPLILASSKAVYRLSLGHRGLLADIYWTRAVQYFGERHHAGAEQYAMLAPFLDITTDLDPQLTVAYQFGSIFLSQPPPEGAGQPAKAVALVEKGIRANPNQWRMYFNLGWIEYSQQNYTAASWAFARAADIPGAPPSMRMFAAIVAHSGNDLGTARYLWSQIYDSTTDKMVRANAVKHLEALQVDEQVAVLELAVQEFRKRTGRFPARPAEMAGLGWRVPQTDTQGNPYRIMPGGRVEVQDPGALPFITRGLPPNQRPALLRPLTQVELRSFQKAVQP